MDKAFSQKDNFLFSIFNLSFLSFLTNKYKGLTRYKRFAILVE